MEFQNSQVEIDAGGRPIRALTYSTNGEYLVTGEEGKVRVWRVGREAARMVLPATASVSCLAVSRDDNWIAAGTTMGSVFVWDAKTYKKVWDKSWGIGTDPFTAGPTWRPYAVFGVDFSPDSSRLVVALQNDTAIAFNDVASDKPTLKLRHLEYSVQAARYSRQGHRIATATHKAVRVWNSYDGHLLVNIKVGVTSQYNTSLLWSDIHLFVISGNKIKQLDVSEPTGSTVAEFLVPSSDIYSCIALSRLGKFIAYSTHQTVSLWDTSTHTKLRVIQYPSDILSMALSPDDQSIAIGKNDGNITLERPSYLLRLFSIFHPASLETEISIDDAGVLESWKNGRPANAETLLTAGITRSPNPFVLACRALVRTRLDQWDAAVVDAEQSIEICPSVLGYIAKSIALVRNGKKHEAYMACDMAFECLHETPVRSLLLIKAVIVFIAREHNDAISRVGNLIATVRDDAVCVAVKAFMHFLAGKSSMEDEDFDGAIRSFKLARSQMRNDVGHPLVVISLISGWNFDDLNEITLGQRLCEALYAARRRKDAVECLLDMMKTIRGRFNTDEFMNEWVSDFTKRCLSRSPPHNRSNLDSNAAESNAIGPMNRTPLLELWAKVTLARRSWQDSLADSVNFATPIFVVYRALCKELETVEHLTDAAECLLQMASKLANELDKHGEEEESVRYFKPHCAKKLVYFGDAAMGARRYEDAIKQYSAALSLDSAGRQALLVKRSKAYAKKALWKDALKDANKVVKLDPSSPCGYERKYVALHGAGHYQDAIDAWETMVLKMSQSPDPGVRARPELYERAKETIRSAVRNAVRESPPVLINTTNGRLCNKAEQTNAFELSPIFADLVLSTTTRINHISIEREVRDYCRYATFSHTWELDEPHYDRVMRVVVYELDESLGTHQKLQMFCKIVRDAGFNWAWSDTCCINKADPTVLQESIVSMFKWYEGSALTIIFLRGVRFSPPRGTLVDSIWNTRGWTFQEYHASKVVRFYTEDWKPYLGLDIPNHKDSPEIISEMEKATRISTEALMALRPGFNDIRRKLCLASRRQTTLPEDVAYSLLGIFTIPMPIVYGEGDKALGRLLANLLASSGDTSILAWTGKSGSYNSFLPTSITVFHESPETHIAALSNSQLDMLAAEIQVSSSWAVKFYDRLLELPVPSFADRRMKLPCLVFALGPLSRSPFPRSDGGLEWAFHAQTIVLGEVKIATNEDLSRMGPLYIVHPWIDFLLGRQTAFDTIHGELQGTDGQSSMLGPPSPSEHPNKFQSKLSRASTLLAGLPFSPVRSPALIPPAPQSRAEKRMQALRAFTRLRRPFGALLLTPTPRDGVAAFKRVAAESLITVQVQDTSAATLNSLVDSVCVLDVL